MKGESHLLSVPLVGCLLFPLLWNTFDVQPPYVFLLTCLTTMAVCFESLKSSATFKDDIYPLMFPLFMCIESSVLMIFGGYTNGSHTFITSIIFGWGIISLWIIFLRAIHHFLPKEWNDQFTMVFGVACTRSMIIQLLALILIASFRVIYASPEHWLVKNIYDVAFIFQSADVLEVSSFQAGCFSMLVMTTFVGSTNAYFMCNYFDMLGPGTFLAFLLRFDGTSRGGTNYFCWSAVGYINGLGLKHYTKHCTKCFMFSVPVCTIGGFLIYFIWKGDNQQLLTFKGSKGVEPRPQTFNEATRPSPEVFTESTNPIPEVFKENVRTETNPNRRNSIRISKKEATSCLKENFWKNQSINCGS